MKNNLYKIIKIILITISIIMVCLTLKSNVITTSVGSTLQLIKYESVYIYFVLIVVSIFLIIRNKNANYVIVISLLTYIWTYLLINHNKQMFTSIDVNIEKSFYVYLSSMIPLILSLFFNDKITSEGPKFFLKNKIDDGLNKEDFIFARFILGPKGIAFNTEVLLFNNTLDKTVDLIYPEDEYSKTIKIPVLDIKNILINTSLKLEEEFKKETSKETKNTLLASIAFGGNSILEVTSKNSFNRLLNDLSTNHKVNFNAYYEITIVTDVDGEEVKYILSTNTDPKNLINNRIKHNC